MERRLSLAVIARECGVGPSTLAIAFRRAFGTSVGEAIRAVRVAQAKSALATTREPLAQIAVRCGFHDQAHFTRVFERPPARRRTSIAVRRLEIDPYAVGPFRSARY